MADFLIFAKAFDKMIRRFSVSFSIWLLFVFSVLIAYMNLIIFFMIVPGICLKIIDKLLNSDNSDNYLLHNLPFLIRNKFFCILMFPNKILTKKY